MQSAGRQNDTVRWLAQYVVPEADLAADGRKLRRPTGLSSDRRTLFFWDEVSGIERAAYRASSAEGFGSFYDVGPQMYAQPTASCQRIYDSQAGATSVNLFYSDAR